MNYPLISEYIEAIKSAEDNFDQLSSLRPVLDSYGNPVMSSGNFAVVFKMKDIDTGKFYAVKCFIKDQKGRNESYAMIADELRNVSSPYIVPIRFLERELFVDSSQSDETEFPVLVLDWVEGKTLDAYLRENLEKKYLLQLLAYRFCQMSAWLMEQPFAHGDLKPDNILVREDGSLVLVDYDGFYVPAMNGQEARELGSPDFRHPQRTSQDFDEYIDDFSIATIALSLKAISLDSQLYNTHAASDRLLLSSTDYHDIGNSATMQKIVQLASDTELATILSVFYTASALKMLYKTHSKMLEIEIPAVVMGVGKTIITQKDVSLAKEKYGELINVIIADSVIEIGEWSFNSCRGLTSITIPNSVIEIAEFAFSDCSELKEINIPSSVTNIGKSVFENCARLSSIIVENGNRIYDSRNNCNAIIESATNTLIVGCKGTIMHNSVVKIGEHAFCGCESLTEVIIPNSVSDIEESAFENCTSLTGTIIPNSVVKIGERAFYGCESLTEVIIPNSVTSIGKSAFRTCISLTGIIIPNTVAKIGNYAFSGCTRLASIIVEEGNNVYDSRNNCNAIIETTTNVLIVGCKNTRIPNSVIEIGTGAFCGCSELTEINIPTSVKKIGESAFSGCERLSGVTIPNTVSDIGESAFRSCTNLVDIIIPNDITEIGAFAFCNCPIQNMIPQRIQQKIKEMEDDYLPF